MNKLYLFLIAIITIVSCEKVQLSPLESYQEGELVTISGSMSVPMCGPTTRAADQKAEIEKMQVYIFDSEGIYLDRVDVKPGIDGNGDTEFSNNGGNFQFHFDAHSSEKPHIYHFVANCNFNYTETDEITMAMRSHITEEDIKDKDIYWQRYELDEVTADTKIENLRLIRVNSKITVNVPDIDYFVYEGFAICNRATTGTVTPLNYNAGYAQKNIDHFAKYVKDNGDPNTYNDLVNGQNYIGCLPTNCVIDKNLPSPEDFTTDAKKVFENPWSEEEGTFIMIKGKYRGHTSYYKVALGQNLYENNAKKRSFYHILRNFNYNINIEKIRNRGFSNLQLAYDSDFSNLIEHKDGVTGNPLLYISADHTYLDNDDVSYLGFKYLYNKSIGFRVQKLGEGTEEQPVFSKLLAKKKKTADTTVFTVNHSEVESFIDKIYVYPSKKGGGRMVAKVCFKKGGKTGDSQKLRFVAVPDESGKEEKTDIYDIRFLHKDPIPVGAYQDIVGYVDENIKPPIPIRLTLNLYGNTDGSDYNLLKTMPNAFPFKVKLYTLDNRIVTDKLPGEYKKVDVPVFDDEGNVVNYEKEYRIVYTASLGYDEFTKITYGGLFDGCYMLYFQATNLDAYTTFVIQVDRFYEPFVVTNRIRVRDLIESLKK